MSSGKGSQGSQSQSQWTTPVSPNVPQHLLASGQPQVNETSPKLSMRPSPRASRLGSGGKRKTTVPGPGSVGGGRGAGRSRGLNKSGGGSPRKVSQLMGL